MSIKNKTNPPLLEDPLPDDKYVCWGCDRPYYIEEFLNGNLELCRKCAKLVQDAEIFNQRY